MRLLNIDEINSLSDGDKVLVEEPRINWSGTCRVEVKNYSNNKRMTSLIPIENKLSKGHMAIRSFGLTKKIMNGYGF
ncbi:hypothetical protein [Bacillus smithii]|uniref:hypothetical protein n=1 Tax=Bacillus smithii TaxID=1479 RepID=UPI002E1F0ECA|nr:hypothetical protein [Bacillus smithii]MED4929173.1 hypothetical protein [Bacillus smithii]